MNINDVLNRLEAQEQSFVASEVLAPVLPGGVVRVRIAGVVCSLRVDDARLEGWSVLQPLSTSSARVVRPARRGEVAAYLKLLPLVRLVVVARSGRLCYALPAHRGDARFHIEAPVPVQLAEEGVQLFDAIAARFDGRLFWFEARDGRRNPALAAYLRESLSARLPPARLDKKGLSAEERDAYIWVCKGLEEARRNTTEERLSSALQHAGARLVSFIERDDAYTVTYRVDGRRRVSTVRRGDLTVLTSGICLSERDRDFDLTSLVGVMREAEREEGW